MLRIAICDDMPDFLNSANKCISQWSNAPDNFTVDCFEDADALLAAHRSNPYHIIFLDVVMPLLGGIEAAGEIRTADKSVKIVFLTSSPEFAVDSYRVKANDYLLKPLNPEMLYSCLDELALDIHEKAKRIMVKGQNSIHQVELQNIEFIESENKYIHYYLADGSTITSSEALYALESRLLLADGFFKCSRSYIVNIYRIDSYSPKEIKMRSGYRIPISRSCQKSFEEAYFSTLFGKAGEQ